MRSLRSRADPRDESGIGILEVVVASAVLVVALATFFSVMARLGQTESYALARQRSLDDLRLAADEFSRDARQAVEVISGTPSRLEFDQYVGPAVARTVWEVFADADGNRHLRRTRAGGTRTFLVALTDQTVFEYRPSAATPSEIRRVRVFMSTQPLERYPAVNLTTEVTLRNVAFANV